MTIFYTAIEAYGNAICYACAAGVIFAFLRIMFF